MMLKRYPLLLRRDRRGWLVQNDYSHLSKKFRHFIVASVQSGEVRGNHYHYKKKEWFFLISGKARLYIYSLKTKKKQQYILDSRTPELIEIGPYIVHTFENIGKTPMIFLGLINEPFHRKKPDTFSYHLR